MYSEHSPEHNRGLETEIGEENVLYDLIEEGEHQQLDFKFRIDSTQKIAKTLSAFANTDGGKLLIGVKDNGKIAGIDPEEEFYMIQGAADVYCKPAVSFSTTVYQTMEGVVLEIDVAGSADRPHFAKDESGKWIAYVRQNDENFAANRVLLNYLRDKTPTKKKNVMAYGPHEKMLFEYLEDHHDISLSKYAKIGKIPLHKAEKTLALFLKWEILGWKATDKGIRFYLLP